MKSLDTVIEMNQLYLCPGVGDRHPKMNAHDGKLLFREIMQSTQDVTSWIYLEIDNFMKMLLHLLKPSMRHILQN